MGYKSTFNSQLKKKKSKSLVYAFLKNFNHFQGPRWHLPSLLPFAEQSRLVLRQIFSFLEIFSGKAETGLFRPENMREAEGTCSWGGRSS
jgi:hypothetical protein